MWHMKRPYTPPNASEAYDGATLPSAGSGVNGSERREFQNAVARRRLPDEIRKCVRYAREQVMDDAPSDGAALAITGWAVIASMRVASVACG
jgi:hypothetical protein